MTLIRDYISFYDNNICTETEVTAADGNSKVSISANNSAYIVSNSDDATTSASTSGNTSVGTNIIHITPLISEDLL